MSDQHNLYIQRLNLVLDTISQHPTQDLSLETLAQVAGFSPFHFHRIFKSIIGETLSQFVWRVRLEYAAKLLRTTPAMSLSQAATDSGFASLASFSRAFKRHYGIAASRWNRSDPLQDRNLSQIEGAFPIYTVQKLNTCSQEFAVTIRELPAQQIAYIRVDDSYSDFARIIDAYHQLLAWYAQQGGTLADTTLYGMSPDDPDLTPLDQCRFDWCLHVPDDWRGSDGISVRALPACQVAVIPMDGDVMLEDRILQYIWRCWLPRSRYQPANLPGMEIYRRFPHEVGWEVFHLDCAIPVVAL